MSQEIRAKVRDYYERRLRQFGTTPAGVDWNSRESQELRFIQLAQLWETAPEASLLDYGCGYGAMATFARQRGHRGAYVGYDVSEAMIAAARERHAGVPDCRFVADRQALEPIDYAVASGIFNVKMETPADEWQDYMLRTLDEMASLSRRGFAFNALTLYSDPERRRPDLYYADPRALFDHCKRTYSRLVALLHDYPLYEFTMVVRLDGAA